MQRLIRDRYFADDDLHGYDLATGDAVRLDALPAEPDGEGHPRDDEDGVGVGSPPFRFAALAPFIEILNEASEGHPRWVVVDAANSAQASTMSVRAASDARRRGYVPVLVPLYWRWRDQLAADLDGRTLLLIGSFSRGISFARLALIDAASRSPRPHVLLTFCSAPHAGGSTIVREARAAYGMPAVVRPRPLALSSDIVRLLDRAAHATAFQRSGRHAAAERLLREVAGSLTRRQAMGPTASILITLGRLLLERGRVDAADKVFDEAARLAQSVDEASALGDARIWQAAARTDAGRLTDGESICRAVLLTGSLSPGRRAWAMAMLARVLLWQGRNDEAQACTVSVPAETADIDPITMATVEATAVRLTLSAGDVFQAGQRARALMTHTAGLAAEPGAHIVALTAHPRVLAASGDLELAERDLDGIEALAREAHMPLRTLRARLIWHDALRQAGRDRDARGERDRLARLRRPAPALLRRAIDERVAAKASPHASSRGGVEAAPARRVAAGAVSLVRLVHHEEDDYRALERVAGRLVRDLLAARVDLVSHDAGPVSTLMSRGAGLPTQLGARVLDAGFAIADEAAAGRELGMPVRMGTRLLGALVCRWPMDRQPPGDAAELLELAAAIAAPRIEALLMSRRETARASTAVPELIGVSAAMEDVRRAIERAARAPFAVLIEGESGSGKELAARAVHQLGARRERRFCDVNCAALPDELLESELFGHARGAFTGAIADKAGLFEEADGGTVFLDEVPDLSLRAQAKL